MEIESIEKKTFDEMLEKIQSVTGYIVSECTQRKAKRMGKWLDAQELCMILNISPRTLQTYRETGKIGFSQINYKIYYKEEDIYMLLQKFSNQTKK